MSNREESENLEDYSSPDYEPFPDPPDIGSTIDGRFLWILLWIMSYRTRFNITETATEALIKFMKLVLTEIGGDDFKDFPNSIYLTKRVLGLEDNFQSFVPCPKCHKLYQKQEVVNFRQRDTLAVMKCHHVEFPNSNRPVYCDTSLSQKIDLSTNRITIRPNLTYPFSGIIQQLTSMYNRPDFERCLRIWANRRQQSDNVLTDIYDGQIWQTLKESSEEDSPNFFRVNVADFHLGLMLNLDWF